MAHTEVACSIMECSLGSSSELAISFTDAVAVGKFTLTLMYTPTYTRPAIINMPSSHCNLQYLYVHSIEH